ncbi:Uncharacterised protein [Kluyvera cryocrescens]|nr:Uncharacterised protein [Kluyvera cryocrescens]
MGGAVVCLQFRFVLAASSLIQVMAGIQFSVPEVLVVAVSLAAVMAWVTALAVLVPTSTAGLLVHLLAAMG